MADALTLEIVTPERVIFRGTVDSVTIPGTEGQFSVLKGHTCLLSSIDIGELYFRQGPRLTRYAVNTGFAEVTASRVTVLVETAERSDVIDRERARRARERAEEELATLPREDDGFQKAHVALLRALVRINVAGKD